MNAVFRLARKLILLLLLATSIISTAYAADIDRPFFSIAKNYHTKHFRVIYHSEDTTLFYARLIGDAAEYSRKKIIEDMAYQEPDYLRDFKLDIYIAQLIKDGENTKNPAFFSSKSSGTSNSEPWIAVNLQSQIWNYAYSNSWNYYSVKSNVAHEYFHGIQNGYDNAERGWLGEATATWIEDKVFLVPERDWNATGWRFRFDDWIRIRRINSSLFSRELSANYGASVFFQYLSERSPGMDGVVRHIWQQAKIKHGPNTYEAIGKALGDPGAWGPQFRKKIGDFAAAIFIGGPKLNSTYSLAKLKNHTQEYLDNNHPLKLGEAVRDSFSIVDLSLKMIGIAVGRVQKKNNINPKAYGAQPYQIKYLQIQPTPQALLPKTEEDPENGKLVIAVRGATHRDWEFRLIEAPILDDIPAAKKWSMRPFPKVSRLGQWSFLEVEKFPYSRPVIVAVNTRPIKFEEDFGDLTYGDRVVNLPIDTFEVAAAFLSPPLVTGVTVAIDEDGQYRPVWKVVREPSSRPGTWRTRVILDEGIRFDKDKAQKIQITVTTNHPIKPNPKMTIGDVEVDLTVSKKSKSSDGVEGSIYGFEFEATLKVDAFASAIEKLKKNEPRVLLPLELTGTDSWGAHFDAKLSTLPRLNSGSNDILVVNNWEGESPEHDFELKILGFPNLGGADRLDDRKLPIHTIDPAAYLARVEARQNGKIIYQAVWQPDPEREGKRQFKLTSNETYDADMPLDVTLTFSEPVKSVKLGVGSLIRGALNTGYNVTLPDPPEGTKTLYSLTVPADEKIKKDIMENGELTLFIEAQTARGIKLDADPRTPAKYDWDTQRFYGLEENVRYRGDTSKGGIDEWHKLNGVGRSLVILLDASGSMAEHSRIEIFKNDIRDVITNLREQDEIALVVFFNCDDIRVMAPFSNNPQPILKLLPGIKPSEGTPLGDALDFANSYLEKNGRYQEKKVLIFSDGQPTCGKSPTQVAQDIVKPPKAPDPPEEKANEIQWSVFRAGGKRGGFIPDYWVEEVSYHEKQGAQPSARLTVRRYPISWISSGERSVWSINWSRAKTVDNVQAAGGGIEALRARAQAIRANGVAKDQVQKAVKTFIGPGAEPLNRS